MLDKMRNTDQNVDDASTASLMMHERLQIQCGMHIVFLTLNLMDPALPNTPLMIQ